jgi:hypothetical protein
MFEEITFLWGAILLIKYLNIVPGYNYFIPDTTKSQEEHKSIPESKVRKCT